MKKQLVMATCSVGLLAVASGAMSAQTPTPISQANAAAQTTQVWLYASPSKSAKVVERLRADADLIPIWQKGKWVKVGDPRDGKVAWINKQQYDAARENFFRPDIQTMYVHVSQNKNGKRTVNIVAYRNGKQLSQKEADVIYKQMRAEQHKEMHSMHRMTQWSDDTVAADMQDIDQSLNGAWLNSPWAQAPVDENAGWDGPVVVMEDVLPPAGPIAVGAGDGPIKKRK